MTMDELVAKWQGPIGDWAIRKGWLKQEADPENPGKLRNVPRDMLHLQMLMITELHELEQAVENEDDANIREEVADFAIRAIQMRAEFGYTYARGLSADTLATDVWQSPYEPWQLVCEAAEAHRDKSLSGEQKEAAIWGFLELAIAITAMMSSPEDVDETDFIQWLDEAIEYKMAANEKRPVMHGKLA